MKLWGEFFFSRPILRKLPWQETARRCLLVGARAGRYSAFISSTLKTSVELGGIGPEPPSP